MKKYGIKCIVVKAEYASVHGVGWGGWNPTVRGWETWCKTFHFPYDNLNMVYHELLRWSSEFIDSPYYYSVEEVPEEEWSLATTPIVGATGCIGSVGATGPTGTRGVTGPQGPTADYVLDNFSFSIIGGSGGYDPPILYTTPTPPILYSTPTGPR